MIELGTIEAILVDGLLLGGIYALAALGISLIFSITNMLNLAHGNFIMMGGILTFVFYYMLGGQAFGGLSLVSTLLIILALFAGIGAFVEILLVRPIFKRSRDIVGSGVLVTIGLALILQDVGSYIIVNDPSNASRATTVSLTIPSFSSILIGGYYFSSSKIVSLIVISISGLILFFFFKKTYLGLAMRSVSQDREAAVIMGVDINRISSITFAIGSAFAGFAGYILVIDQTADPALGIGYTIKLLTIMVLGGTRSPIGPVVGGLLLGVIELTIGYLLGAYWITAASLAILISILLIRPSGLMGRGGE